MNSNSPDEGDPPGQFIRIASPEPRDSQGRTLEMAQLQDRSRREADAFRRWSRAFRPLVLLHRVCGWFAIIAMIVFPLSLLALGIIIESDYTTIQRLLFGLFVGSLAYLCAYSSLLAPWLDARLMRICEAAMAEGVDLHAAFNCGSAKG